MLSIHWRGRVFDDIESVVTAARETRTAGGLRVHCWFDPKKYLTNEEKRAQNLFVPTRETVAEKLDGRIVHPYSPDTAMYAWNYVIFPHKVSEKVLAEEAARVAYEDLADEAAKIMVAVKEEKAAKAAAKDAAGDKKSAKENRKQSVTEKNEQNKAN